MAKSVGFGALKGVGWTHSKEAGAGSSRSGLGHRNLPPMRARPYRRGRRHAPARRRLPPVEPPSSPPGTGCQSTGERNTMSVATQPEVTLEELSLETVELLPGRELMNCC